MYISAILIGVLCIVILILALKLFNKFTVVWDRSPTCLLGKTVIVTGSNTGIGFYTAQDFAKRGARVILACRNESRAKAAQSKIIETTGNQNIVIYPLDLSSLASIRKFVTEVKQKEEKLHILVNNAGGMWLDGGNEVSCDGINLIKQINYVGPFLLTVLLLDLLKESAPSRIVNLSSIMCQFKSIDSNILHSYNGKFKDYGQSKLLSVLFTNELAHRLKNKRVVTNSVDPGEVDTDFTRNLPPAMQKPAKIFKYLFFKTAAEGAQTSIHVAVAPDLAKVTGKYFVNCAEPWILGMPKVARDPNLCRKMFEDTLELVKLSDNELKQLHNVLLNYPHD